MLVSEYVKWFEEIGIDDVAMVGGKNASLGEMYRELRPLGVPIPNGFATTAAAFYLTIAGIRDELSELMDGVGGVDVSELARRGRRARELVYSAPLPDQLIEEISTAFRRLQEEYTEDVSVAVRSSATAEDLPTASFAGQHETFLNVTGLERVLEAVKRCYASLFTDRAISYREGRGFDHMEVGLSAGVQKMVRADIATSGVMFSIDTESGFPDVVFITGAYGLGENVVQGTIDPDEFYVHKPTYRDGNRVVLRRNLGAKHLKMVYAQARSGQSTLNVPTPDEDRARFSVTDDEVLALAGYAIAIEDHYSARAGKPTPMDIEWAKDGVDGGLYIVQARPETVSSQTAGQTLAQYHVPEPGEALVEGRAVGAAVGIGQVRVVTRTEDLALFQPGEILVADTTTPDWEPVMKTASALVTNRGGRTCHAAIVAREIGIPAVVGTGNGTTALENGRLVTVSCAEGDIGRVYAGEVPFEVTEVDVSTRVPTRTHLMVNIGNPDQAFGVGRLPVDGVGLARMEFIISESIQAHPMALIHPERVEEVEQARIAELIAGYADGSEFFVKRLAEGVGTIAAAFYPRPVVVRMSDFKTNEYASLVGGKSFEPDEANPMIGFRGAARYTHPAYREGFDLECRAIKRVREEMGLTNVIVMIPFCRRVDEARRVLGVMAENGLERGVNGLQVYVMCEIPNNVVQIDAFADLFDGFSIGSNDLTQLILGVDRDSELVEFEFDERDPGVMAAIRQAVEGAHRHERHIGICGQGPSDYPEMAEDLVEMGIDSMSLDPNTVMYTAERVAAVEEAMLVSA